MVECSPQKEQVRASWNESPCGIWTASSEKGTREYFEELTSARYELERYIPGFAEFERWKDKKVLEVGFGQGTDMYSFVKAGAAYTGIELTEAGFDLARRRLELLGMKADLRIGDAEKLPFDDDAFDLVYSFGVIHHTPDTEAAARELIRVCKEGGEVRAMIYNRRSLFALQAYIVYGLLRGRPLRGLADIFASHIESPGTKAFTIREARALFEGLSPLRVAPRVTPYDLRLGRRRFLPQWMQSITPSVLGFNLLIKGQKPLKEK